MKIALAQINTRVGGVDANTRKILDAAQHARDALGCRLILFPELTLSGYPPEDLLLHRGLRTRVEAAFDTVLNGVSGIAMYIGYPEYQGEFIYNAGALLLDGEVLARHRKNVLPNYGV
ncbi:MAG: NAD+ synthase, partial [Gammaproteobacteria bacterium]|nr:NAD+ synthase [Gammaproteobacteria bacterium]